MTNTFDTAELKRLLAEATPRPWEIAPDMFGNVLPENSVATIHWYDVDADNDGRACDYGHDICEIADTKNHDENALLIVAAVNALPGLLERVEELERENADLRDLCTAAGELYKGGGTYPIKGSMSLRLLKAGGALKGAKP